MTRQELIKELSIFFDIRELVCPDVYAMFKNKSWQFFDFDTLLCLLILRRDILKVGMNINNWHYWKSENLHGERFSQRGLRCNICEICKDKTVKNTLYMSGHSNGAAFDFTTKEYTAVICRKMISDKALLFPCKVRMEANVSWGHFDTYDDPTVNQQYWEF